MYNASGILKTKYYTSIKAALPSVAVFKNYVPNQLTADNYVLISNVQQVDYSNISKHDVKAFITIGIYTRAVPENDGIGMEDIADAIFSLYPTPQSYPDITGYQVCSLQLESDNELTVSLDSGNTYINRSITFSHILNKLN
jgi:hypothetical protein